jgi:uncharacterized protein with NAD-binding domain and iron-sulfur cluster
VTDTPRPKKNIAILGGGVGALTAAFELTARPGWRDRYEVTVYQVGWRLGGKGASGRNPVKGQRIEEHGLHIWLGFYANAFRLLRDCYKELGRKPGEPLATWDEAFRKQSRVTFMEQVDGEWVPWTVDFPTNDNVPGDGGEFPTPWAYVQEVLRLMFKHHERATPWPVRWFRHIRGALAGLWGAAGRAAQTALHQAHLLAQSLPDNPKLHPPEHHGLLLSMLEGFLTGPLDAARKGPASHTRRRTWMVLELGATIVCGMLRDGVLYKGFNAIDQHDFKEWLQLHGLREPTLSSAPVRSVYDLVFGFAGGDSRSPNVAAGTGLRNLFRTFCFFKGAITWKMQAGMGEAFFTPLYEVLRRRGVAFRFFHRVEQLRLSADRKSIDAIDVAVQATVKDEVVREHGGYQPLVNVKGLACWPNAPRYEQLVEGDELLRQNINLESAWTSWRDPCKRTLKRGEHFDDVVLGISLGALPHLCQELIAENPKWRDMVEHVKTAPTQAFQLWLNRDVEQLGWRGPERNQGCTYLEPLDNWADMTQVLDWEDWPDEAQVRTIVYFCGPMPDPAQIPPPFTDPGFPAAQEDRVRQQAVEFLQTSVGPLWKGGTSPENPQGLDWNLLVAPAGVSGADRFDHQFWRANIDPSERYVLCLKGTIQYRLPAHPCGFDNLYLAGDWVLTNVNSGCVEAAVMAGMQASRALCGYPKVIVGEKDLFLAHPPAPSPA